MALSDSTLAEIRAELAELHRVQERVTDRIKALEAILTPFDFAQFGLPFQVRPATASGMQIAQEPPSGNGHGLQHPISTMPLRPAILEVLKEIGPARAPIVAEVLAKKGYPTAGKTRFSTRVYNDLWRMGNTGLIKSENGEFSL